MGVCQIVSNQQTEFAAGEPLIGVSATGQTRAAVNITFEVNRRVQISKTLTERM
jgi:hypothetical protein